jgi:catechol 2,3-dioxygenase-like lactoylglutathione lyase family enzyme
MDMKLEVLFVPVSDVDRVKRFYEKLGFRLDIDVANGDFRGIQFTPPNSETSIIFGKGITTAQPGSIDPLVLAVYDIDAARDKLIAQGVASYLNARQSGKNPEEATAAADHYMEEVLHVLPR